MNPLDTLWGTGLHYATSDSGLSSPAIQTISWWRKTTGEHNRGWHRVTSRAHSGRHILEDQVVSATGSYTHGRAHTVQLCDHANGCLPRCRRWRRHCANIVSLIRHPGSRYVRHDYGCQFLHHQGTSTVSFNGLNATVSIGARRASSPRWPGPASTGQWLSLLAVFKQRCDFHGDSGHAPPTAPANLTVTAIRHSKSTFFGRPRRTTWE